MAPPDPAADLRVADLILQAMDLGLLGLDHRFKTIEPCGDAVDAMAMVLGGRRVRERLHCRHCAKCRAGKQPRAEIP